MIVHTRHSLAAEAADKWDRQYKGSRQDVSKAIRKLNNMPDPEEVDRIIGNHMWTSSICTECKCSSDTVIQLGEKPDWESQTVFICPNCIRMAFGLLESNGKKIDGRQHIC